MNKKLTPKQELFVQEYLVDLNAAQAAIRAGYSAKTAKEIGAENLTKPHIRQRVEELKAERIERVQYDADQVLRDLVGMLRFDIRTLYDENGDLLTPSEWPDEAVMAITGIDVSSTRLAGNKDDDPLDLWTKRVRFVDKVKVLQTAGRHVNIRAFDNTVKLDIPPKVIRNFTGRKANSK